MPISREESCDFIGGVGRRDARAYARKANPLRFRPFGDDLDRGYPWPRDYRSATLRLPVVGAPYHRDMRVLIVEDDPLLADGLRGMLRREGYVTDCVGSAEAAEAALATATDLVILDVGLPGMDGFAWLRRLRASGGDQTVLLLTARDAVADRVRGLELGADDYLPKPFAPEELVARVAALARRSRARRSQVVEHGRLTIDLAARRARLGGASLELAQREYALLELLFTNVGTILSKERIADAIATWDAELSHNAVETHVSRLRAKLEPGGVKIRTVRGLGYLVDPE
jgi:two-component system OmpR family response regulator